MCHYQIFSWISGDTRKKKEETLLCKRVCCDEWIRRLNWVIEVREGLENPKKMPPRVIWMDCCCWLKTRENDHSVTSGEANLYEEICKKRLDFDDTNDYLPFSFIKKNLDIIWLELVTYTATLMHLDFFEAGFSQVRFQFEANQNQKQNNQV